MARAKKNGHTSIDDVQVPEGFGISVGRERGEGWVLKEEGNEVLGRLLSRHSYNLAGKKRAYYQVKLIKPCKVQIDDPDAGEDNDDAPRITVTMDAGKIVNIDETAKLTDLETYCRNGGVYDLWFVYGPQDPNFRNMWTMKGPRLKVIKRPSEVPQDEVPF